VRERIAHQVPDDLPQPRLIAQDKRHATGLNR
jgi:hypothetical protein